MESGGIRIGTCSWTERSLIESGVFYPKEVASAEERLRFYASRFDTVEVDSSYFTIPTVQMTRAWVERTPPSFLFHIKAYGAFTGHVVDPGELPVDLRNLLPEGQRYQQEAHISESGLLTALAQAMGAALEPLKEARKLGFVIFQFPPWFSCKNANRDYILHCKELFPGMPIAVEFRHGSWLGQHHAGETFRFLREHRITYVTCDEPQCGTLSCAPFLPEVTTSVAYLRLHGRNAEQWFGDGRLRYQYLYTEQELSELAAEARRLSARSRTTFVMFKNCHCGHAVTNAMQLRGMLTPGYPRQTR